MIDSFKVHKLTEDVQGHPRPGDKLREKFTRMFPRRIARRYFD